MGGTAVGDCDSADEVDMMSGVAVDDCTSVESEGVDEVGMARGNAATGEDGDAGIGVAGIGVSGITITKGGAEVGKYEGEVQSIVGDKIGDDAGVVEIRADGRCRRLYGLILPHTLANFLPPNIAPAKSMS